MPCGKWLMSQEREEDENWERSKSSASPNRGKIPPSSLGGSTPGVESYFCLFVASYTQSNSTSSFQVNIINLWPYQNNYPISLSIFLFTEGIKAMLNVCGSILFTFETCPDSIQKEVWMFFYILLYLMKSKGKCCTLENITNCALKQAINFHTIHFHSQKSVRGS